MTAVADLYRAVILEHGKRPRNVGRLAHATLAADGDNPLCGDALHLEIELDGAVLVALRFDGESCVVATASASLMTERLTGATTAEARLLSADMATLCATGSCPGSDGEPGLGELRVFADVHRHPVRVSCATLPWRTLRTALGD
jgi:nitrogen fixation NifU-like protein